MINTKFKFSQTRSILLVWCCYYRTKLRVRLQPQCLWQHANMLTVIMGTNCCHCNHSFQSKSSGLNQWEKKKKRCRRWISSQILTAPEHPIMFPSLNPKKQNTAWNSNKTWRVVWQLVTVHCCCSGVMFPSLQLLRTAQTIRNAGMLWQETVTKSVTTTKKKQQQQNK